MITPDTAVQALSDSDLFILIKQVDSRAVRRPPGMLAFARAVIAADRALRALPAPDAEFVLEQISVYINALEANGDEPSAEHEAAVEAEWVVLERAVCALAAAPPAPKEAPAGAPISQPEAACVRAALLLALDYSTSNLIHIDSLYGGYPENGLGRKVKAAREEVAMVRRALAATPPAAAQEKP